MSVSSRHRHDLEELERRRLFAVGDTIATATAVAVSHAAETEISASIGDEASGGLDVDMFKVTLNAGDRILVDVDAYFLDDGSTLSSLDGLARLYDSAGFFITGADDSVDPDTGNSSVDPSFDFTAGVSGDYYIGISGFPNYGYDPNVAGSGEAGSTGDYHLQLVINQYPFVDTINLDAVVGVTTPIDVLSHASDPDGDTLRIVGVSVLGSGSASINDNATPADFSDDYVAYTGNFASGFTDELYVAVSDGYERFYGYVVVSLSGAQLQPDWFTPGKTSLFIGGGSGNDVINIAKKAGKQRQLVATINGVQRTFPEPTGAIYVSAKQGDDRVTVESTVSTPAYLYGSFGNDILIGGAGNDILVGGEFYDPDAPDADQLSGGNGRDLLIGGYGADRLDGGADDDILVGGTSYAMGLFAGIDIMREWTRTDQSYNNRVFHLFNGGGLNSYGDLNIYTCFDDSAIDRLTGGGGRDLYAANGDAYSTDVITDLKRDEMVFDVD